MRDQLEVLETFGSEDREVPFLPSAVGGYHVIYSLHGCFIEKLVPSYSRHKRFKLNGFELYPYLSPFTIIYVLLLFVGKGVLY